MKIAVHGDDVCDDDIGECCLSLHHAHRLQAAVEVSMRTRNGTLEYLLLLESIKSNVNRVPT